jgi:hypothetical protein
MPAFHSMVKNIYSEVRGLHVGDCEEVLFPVVWHQVILWKLRRFKVPPVLLTVLAYLQCCWQFLPTSSTADSSCLPPVLLTVLAYLQYCWSRYIRTFVRWGLKRVPWRWGKWIDLHVKLNLYRGIETNGLQLGNEKKQQNKSRSMKTFSVRHNIHCA